MGRLQVICVNKNMNISVIIPVFNVEHYIERCLNSLLQQTITDFEIVIVDDGSTDRTREICEQYQKYDDRIRIIGQKNMGVAIARNVGLKMARGEWISFVDADDYVENYYLESLYSLVINNNAQMSIGGSLDTDGTSGLVIDQSKKVIGKYSAQDTMKLFLCKMGVSCVMWGKLFAKKLFDAVVFNQDNYVGEDLDVFYRLIDKCQHIAIDTSVLCYHYMMNAQSLIHSCTLEKRVKELDTIETMISFIEHKYPSLISDAYNFKYKQVQEYMSLARKGYCIEDKTIYQLLRKQYLKTVSLVYDSLGVKEYLQCMLYKYVPIQLLKIVWK